ncbi:MAG: FAD-dependent oxidoreductase [Leptospiraceae bacterium]|nr:FAD-dependent oxidoreductase [Leptospiraceae bacterium]MCK6381092.1 FAD-dependent oxidoreductase [Leptospiraceae bacterium]NUM40543.1 FAD-dependent oxidoreductase [Leptospiraceae bacterium]
MSQQTIVILGGSSSGPTAAAKVREFDEKSRIIIVEKTNKIDFFQSGISYFFSGEVNSIEDFQSERADFFRTAYNIEIKTETEVVKIDPKKKEIILRGKYEGTLGYDSLIYALGAESSVPDKLISKPMNFISFRTASDLQTIQKYILENKKKVAIIGAGSFGLEATDGLIRAGLEISLIEKRNNVFPSASQIASKMIENEIKSKCKIYKSAEITGFYIENEKIVSIKLKSGDSISVDFVISAMGVKPNTKLLSSVGAKVTKEGALILNSSGKTNLPGVYGCGACCAVSHVVYRKKEWMPQASISDKLAQIVGANVVGGKFVMNPVTNSLLLRIGNLVYGRAGVIYTPNQKIASTIVFAPPIENFISGAKDIFVQIVWEKKSGVVIGAEIVGESGVDKRLDTIVMAISNRTTIQKLSTIDLGYAPPFSPARDPINVAGTVALYEKKNLVKTIGSASLAKNLSKYFIVDLSKKNAFASSSIPNSTKIPLEELRGRITDIPKNKPIVTVSETGRRGYLGYRVLVQSGYRDVVNLSGGLRAYNLSL